MFPKYTLAASVIAEPVPSLFATTFASPIVISGVCVSPPVLPPVLLPVLPPELLPPEEFVLFSTVTEYSPFFTVNVPSAFFVTLSIFPSVTFAFKKSSNVS